jgi:nitroimidazol reductase NimA-like FMN-containing flavoprotein (pyridoxamine 5'-phosphate oxidase superfamily)
MSTPDGSHGLLRKIVETQRFAVLSTLSNHQPYSSLVAFAVSDDFRHLSFATNRRTRKYYNILENNKVALLINNSSNNQTDFTEALAVTALGTANEIADDSSNAIVKSYLKKHQALTEFVNRQDTAIIDVLVADYILARFDRAERIQVNDIS